MDNYNIEDSDQAVGQELVCEGDGNLSQNESVDDNSLFIVYGGHVVKDEIIELNSSETDDGNYIVENYVVTTISDQDAMEDVSGPANMECVMVESHDVGGTECGIYQPSTSSVAGHVEPRTNNNDEVEVENVGRGGVDGGRITRVVGGRRGGAGRGAIRRARVRTRGARRGRGKAQPKTSHNYDTGLIEEDSTRGLLNDVPMETHLIPEKRRRFLGPSGPAETDPLAGPSRVDPLPPPSPPTAGPSTSPSSYSYDEMIIPPPAAFEDLNVGGCTSKLGRQRPLRDSDNPKLPNYGSEEDSDLDDAEEFDSGLFPTLAFMAERDVTDKEESAAQPSEPEQLSPSSSLSVGPHGLFDFEWRNFPNPPVPPTERREVFSQTNCGPTATAPYRTPYDAFIAIWTREFMEYIVVETNRYAQQVVDKQYQDGCLGPNSRINNWRDTNVNELYCFFGLLIGFGLCVKGDIKEYWYKEGGLATPNIAKYMSLNRFYLLSRCLHFNDITTDLRTMTRPQAKLFKIAPVVQHLNHQFQSLYNLNRNVALDESLTLWKGWLDIKQFIKNKVASTGIKTYEVCEAQTGYLWRIKVHAGREEVPESEVTPVSGVIPTLVLELLKGLEYKGHTIWMDNYYNSPALARVLKSLGFDCVGTLRTNRQCVPPQLAHLKESDMVVGQISGCTSGDVDVMVWRDKCRVGIISTYHGAGVHADKNGIIKPIAIRDYNLCMGGVDKKDQMLSAYPIERKRGQVWYKKFFKRLLNASILNAFILYKHSSSDTRARIRHREFRVKLFDQIMMQNYSHPGRSIQSAPVFDTCALSKEMLEHFLAEYGILNVKKSNEKMRRTCCFCGKRVPTYCPKCNVALCIGCSRGYHARKYNIK